MAIFLTGLIVVAVTTWDVERQIRYNNTPVTEHQKRALEEWLDEKRQRVSDKK